MATKNQRLLIALVQDEPGVLTRIATAFRRRGLNVASLAVSNSEKAGFSRMTFVVDGPDFPLAAAHHHLARLVEVVDVQDVTNRPTITSELALMKVAVKPDTVGEINNIAARFDAKAVDLTEGVITFEVVGSPETLDAMVTLLDGYGVLEMSRTGRISTLKNSVCDDEEVQKNEVAKGKG